MPSNCALFFRHLRRGGRSGLGLRIGFLGHLRETALGVVVRVLVAFVGEVVLVSAIHAETVLLPTLLLLRGEPTFRVELTFQELLAGGRGGGGG